MDEENYQKLEFDMMEPDLQMLTRIADFYEVDAYDLKTAIIGGGEQVGASSRFDDPAPKIVGQNEKKSSGSMLVPTLKLKMGFCVGLTALFSFLLLLYFVCPLVSNSAELPYLGETYIKIRFVDCLSGEGFVLADAIIVLLLNIWLVVDSILLWSSKRLRNGKFGYVSLILSIVFSVVMLINIFYLLAEGFDCVLILLFCFAIFAALVISILAFGDSLIVGENEEKRSLHYNIIRVFLGVLIAAAVLCLVFGCLGIYDGDVSDRVNMLLGGPLQFSIIVIVNSIVFLSSKKALFGSYVYIGSAIELLSSVLILLLFLRSPQIVVSKKLIVSALVVIVCAISALVMVLSKKHKKI